MGHPGSQGGFKPSRNIDATSPVQSHPLYPDTTVKADPVRELRSSLMVWEPTEPNLTQLIIPRSWSYVESSYSKLPLYFKMLLFRAVRSRANLEQRESESTVNRGGRCDNPVTINDVIACKTPTALK